MTLYYLPLEGYQQRYTMQWAAPKTGWLEREWVAAGVDYVRVEPPGPQERRVIGVGSVVDAVGRSAYCFDQIKSFLAMAESGKVKDTDVVLLDDFWTPGFEAIPYALHLLGLHPRVYAFLHAQSVDRYDFTFPMRRWMRPTEAGFAAAMAGIFVCCPTLRDLVVQGGIAPWEKVHVTGHPFSPDEVLSRMPVWYRQWAARPKDLVAPNRENKVVWSSRFDKEKNPHFFLDLVERSARVAFPRAQFVVCTSAPKLRSNDQSALDRLRMLADARPDLLRVREGLTKEEYYEELCTAKVQFNCADQDFVAITLLEASVAGCYPIYPEFRSFPETFLERPGFMYRHKNVGQAMSLLTWVLSQTDLWTADKIRERAWIHNRFRSSWLRMLAHMGVQYSPEIPANTAREAATDPFDPEGWGGVR